MFRSHQVFVGRCISSHQESLIHLFVSLAALRDLELKQILIHQTCTKVIHMELQTNIEMEFCRRVAL